MLNAAPALTTTHSQKPDQRTHKQEPDVALRWRVSLWVLAWITAAVAFVIPTPLLLLYGGLSFPAGLLYLLPTFEDGYQLALGFGWVAYAILTIFGLLQRRRGRYFATFGLLCGLLALNVIGWRVSIVQGVSMNVVSASGSPLSDAFVVYDYYGKGSLGGTFTEPGTILRTDKQGHFRIPSTFFFRIPLFQEPVKLRIDLIWSPQTHNRIFFWSGTTKEEEVPKLYHFMPSQRKLVLYDLTEDTGQWFFTIEQLRHLLQEMADSDPSLSLANVNASSEMHEALRQAITKDINAFADRHGAEVFKGQTGDPSNGLTYRRLVAPEVPLPPVPQQTKRRS